MKFNLLVAKLIHSAVQGLTLISSINCSVPGYDKVDTGPIRQRSSLPSVTPGPRLNKKDGLTRYGDSHVKDKTS